MSAPEVRTHTQAVLWLVEKERERQDDKWGEQNHSLAKWLAILVEEVGEFAKAALEERPAVEVREELAQVAAVAVAAIECLDRRRYAAADNYAAALVSVMREDEEGAPR